jgi:hypothetical protein
LVSKEKYKDAYEEDVFLVFLGSCPYVFSMNTYLLAMVHVDAKEHVLGMPYQRHVNMVNKQKGLC